MPPRSLIVVGWTEIVGLPDLGLQNLRAKIDTGARTSALHADDIEPYERDGEPRVRFRVHHGAARARAVHDLLVHDHRAIRNTSGVPEERFVIRTRLAIAGRVWRIELSLTDRSAMRLPMIVGRTALASRNVAVHTRRTGVAGTTYTRPAPSEEDLP